MLGEGFCADNVIRLRAREVGDQCRNNKSGHAENAHANANPAAKPDSTFDQREQLIDREGKRRSRAAAEQDEHPVLRLQSRKNVVTQTCLANRRRQRRRADDPDGSGANARHDDRQRQRQFDHNQRLAWRHADAFGGLDDRRIDALQTRDGVPQHREHAVEGQCQYGRQKSECGKTESEKLR